MCTGNSDRIGRRNGRGGVNGRIMAIYSLASHGSSWNHSRPSSSPERYLPMSATCIASTFSSDLHDDAPSLHELLLFAPLQLLIEYKDLVRWALRQNLEFIITFYMLFVDKLSISPCSNLLLDCNLMGFMWILLSVCDDSEKAKKSITFFCLNIYLSFLLSCNKRNFW